MITDPAEAFDGAQLIDFEGLCLEYPELPTLDDEGNEQFVITTQECGTYDPDASPEEQEAQIALVKRQTWLIENTDFTNEQFIIRAVCTDRAIKRFVNQETITHSNETLCGVYKFRHFDLKLVDLTECVADNELGINECLHFLGKVDL